MRARSVFVRTMWGLILLFAGLLLVGLLLVEFYREERQYISSVERVCRALEEEVLSICGSSSDCATSSAGHKLLMSRGVRDCRVDSTATLGYCVAWCNVFVGKYGTGVEMLLICGPDLSESSSIPRRLCPDKLGRR